MDLEKENSGVGSLSDNEAVAKNGNLVSGDDMLSKIENNGIGEGEHVSVETVKDSELGDLKPVMVTRSSDSGSPLVSPGTVVKGKGLRKWRRIKREGIKEGNLNVDNSKMLKRGLSSVGVGVQPGKTTQSLSEMRQISEGSVTSSNEVLKNPEVLLDGFGMIDDSGLIMAPVFAAGAESVNKEDSLSTNVGVSKLRDGRSVSAGHLHDRNRAKSYSGKSSSGSVQKGQQDKTTTGTSKKMRAGHVSIEKQNYYSSLESDSRSSNVILTQDNNYLANKGKQNGGSSNYAGENGVQAHRQGDQFQTNYVSNNGTGFEDVSKIEMSAGSSQGVEGEGDKQESSADQDPLIESIQMLQSVQEALEEEVQKLREIRNEDILATDSRAPEWTTVNSEVNDQSSSLEDNGHPLHELESEVSSLKENAHLLKIKLEENTALLTRKEADISELEARLGSRSMREDNESLFVHDHLDVGAELESIFRGKIEAEVKYLTIYKTIQDLRVASVDKISLLEQQIASDKSQILKSAKKLESYNKDVRPDETIKLQSNVCKYSWCLLLQVILLIVVLGLLSPHSTEVAPT